MKLTVVVLRQHIGRMTRRHWYAHSQRNIQDKNKEQVLISKGITISDPLDVLEKPTSKLTIDIINCKSKSDEIVNEEQSTSLNLNEYDYLIDGVTQAQIITNTVLFNNIPQKVNNSTKVSSEISKLGKRFTESSLILNSHQEALPKLKDLARPYFVFPRQYGLTKHRKINNLYGMFLQLCESVGGLKISKNNTIVRNCQESLKMEKNNSTIYMSLPVDLMILSKNPIKPLSIGDYENNNLELPNMFPMECTVGLRKENVHEPIVNPFLNYNSNLNVHTIFSHFDSDELLEHKKVEMPMSDTQMISKAMLKSFIAAATCAQHKYGSTVKDLPEPVCVQCVQSDGRSFHFSLYQLNTLDLNSSSNKNFWWSDPIIDLYTECAYVDGKPTLLDYNENVFQKILTFYMNQ